MAMNYEGVKSELRKIFSSSDDRKIIFWYDEPKNFVDNINTDDFPLAEIVIYNNNSFEIKHLLEVEDKKNNYLLYFPMKKPSDSENWLLDILLYSEEYYADTVALTMRGLNLENPELRRVIQNHQSFFNSKARIEKLMQNVKLNDNLNQNELRIGMMTVLVKAKFSNIEYILRELVFECDDSNKYDLLLKYGFEDFLWNQISEHTNYTGQLSIGNLIKKFMMTAMIKSSEIRELSVFYKQYIIEDSHFESGIDDALIFVHNLKTDDRYDLLQDKLSNELRIEELLSPRGIKDITSCDVFEVLDKFIINSILHSLNQGSLDFTFFESIVKDHRVNSKWFEKYSNSYGFILNAIQFMKKVEAHINEGLKPNEYIKYYSKTISDVDMFYRKTITSYKLIEEESTDLDEFVLRIDKLYENKYLSRLGDCFSKSLEQEPSWSFPGLLMSTDFYMEIQRTPYKKMFVIISDGLRYEVGKELSETISSDDKLTGTVEIKPMVSLLPSDTRFGMASLLPHSSISYDNKNVYVDGMSTSGTENRRKIMKSKNEMFDVITYSDIDKMTKKDLRSFMSDKSLVYIYHNTIDNAGEHNEDKVFEAAGEAVDEITKLIKKLYNTLQYSNFYITADHGFLYKRQKIENHHKYDDIVSLKLNETSKRYLISENPVTIPYTLNYKMNHLGSNHVVVPYSNDIFKTQGGGIQYIHGGASLQEIVIPLIKVSGLRADKVSDAIGPVGVRLKSVQRKITNRSFTLEFEQYEKIEDKKKERIVEVGIIDETGNSVSGRYTFIANSTSSNPESRVTKLRMSLSNTDFDRGNRYFLEMKDKETNEILEKEQFLIDILGFKSII